MSLDSDRRRVARLAKEIANLETKIADRRVRAAKEREGAKRAADAIGPTSSAATIRTKHAEITRRQKAAADHDAKAAALQVAAAGRDHPRPASRATNRIDR